MAFLGASTGVLALLSIDDINSSALIELLTEDNLAIITEDNLYITEE